jgi:hypothetical protein
VGLARRGGLSSEEVIGEWTCGHRQGECNEAEGQRCGGGHRGGTWFGLHGSQGVVGWLG